MWGADRPRPEGDLRRFYELAMDGIADSDEAIVAHVERIIEREGKVPMGGLKPVAAGA